MQIVTGRKPVQQNYNGCEWSFGGLSGDSAGEAAVLPKIALLITEWANRMVFLHSRKAGWAPE